MPLKAEVRREILENRLPVLRYHLDQLERVMGQGNRLNNMDSGQTERASDLAWEIVSSIVRIVDLMREGRR